MTEHDLETWNAFEELNPVEDDSDVNADVGLDLEDDALTLDEDD